ncbi:MAG TPA: tetratricopeptide repeat protein [Gemmatimonadales bacterium]|jgi:predicted negative regulator of RcsB-dependent stress response
MATTVAPTSREAAGSTPPTPWYRDRNRQLIVAGVTIAAVCLIAWFLVTSGKRKEAFAARSLSQARATAEAGNLPLASSELQKLIQTYKGTDAASEAVITLNQIRLLNGQGELAAVGLRDFLASKPDRKYLAPTNGLLGASLENSRKWADAGDAFARASETADVEYLKARYLIDAGRAYAEAGKKTEAATAYRTVITKYPKSSSLTEAQVRLAELTGGQM